MKTAVALCLAGWLLGSGSAALRAAEIIEFRGLAQGTTYTVKVVGGLDAPARQALQGEIDQLLADFDAQVSTYRPDSELSRFNAFRGAEWFPVSPNVIAIVERSREISQQSGGAFDVTISPLIRLWRFDRRTAQPQVPAEESIAAARQLVGYQHLEFRREPPALRKRLPELEVNLNAIAPGYSVDLIVDRLQSRGLMGFMVEVGGELRTGGRKPDGTSWRIGIERPTESSPALQAALPVDDLAVATSGDYRQFFVADGRRYSHTIDPHTGRPVTHGLASVTVLADDCMSADGYSTALMVLGPEQGLALAEREGLAVWMLIRDDAGRITTTASSAFTNGVGRRLEDLTGGGTTLAATSTAAAAESSANGDGAAATPAESPWSTLLFTVGVFAVAMAGLAIGLILRGRALRGSCGGLAGLRDEHGHPMCPSCSTPPEQCREFRRQFVPPVSEDDDVPADRTG